MASSPSLERVASLLLSQHDLELVSLHKLQTLWAGYGHICALTARATSPATAKLDSLCPPSPDGTYRLILKLISPPPTNKTATHEGHLRKMLSYQVEQRFYQHIAPRLDRDTVAVAQCLASSPPGFDTDEGELARRTATLMTDELSGLTATLMTDLRPAFPVAGGKRSLLSETQAVSALEWLARFHATSWAWLPDNQLDSYVRPPLDEVQRPEGSSGSKLWLNGGYTYLATRRDEYQTLLDDYGEWKEELCTPDAETGLSVAEMAAGFLTPRGRDIESYIHGDVKSENLFTSHDGARVAFYDFQYVGLGLGVCDLAKLFTCSVPMSMLADGGVEQLSGEADMSAGERRLLERYRDTLLAAAPPLSSGRDYPWDELVRHWETALVDWLRFQASWGFWGHTGWLGCRVRRILHDPEWKAWLRAAVRESS